MVQLDGAYRLVSVLPNWPPGATELNGSLSAGWLYEPGAPSIDFVPSTGRLSISAVGVENASIQLADAEVDWLRRSIRHGLQAVDPSRLRYLQISDRLSWFADGSFALQPSPDELIVRVSSELVLEGAAAAFLVPSEGEDVFSLLLRISGQTLELRGRLELLADLMVCISPVRRRLVVPEGSIVYPGECAIVTPEGDYWRLDVDGFHLELDRQGQFMPPRHYDASRQTHVAWRIRAGGNPHGMGYSSAGNQYRVVDQLVIELPEALFPVGVYPASAPRSSSRVEWLEALLPDTRLDDDSLVEWFAGSCHDWSNEGLITR